MLAPYPKSWSLLISAGLPQRHVYNIIFRHAMGIRGDTLAFGTTAGNLYLSDDRDDHWRCLEHNLAVVYLIGH